VAGWTRIAEVISKKPLIFANSKTNKNRGFLTSLRQLHTNLGVTVPQNASTAMAKVLKPSGQRLPFAS
jgi:hypothetical protein